jgi:hypothetical protein
MPLSLPNRMSEPSAVAQLIQSLDERTDLPPQADLNELFEQLRVGALGTIFGWIPRIVTSNVRTLLESAADRLAAANTSELVRLLGSSDGTSRSNRYDAPGRSRPPRPCRRRPAAPGRQAMRLAAVNALAEISTPGATPHLDRARRRRS